MENQLTSLLKKKYGTTTSSPVVFTDKDTLYTAFRKLADNIYKNGSWTQEDEIRAVDTFIRNRYGYPVGTEKALVLDWNGQPWSAEVKIRPVEEVESIMLRSKAEGQSVYSAIATRKEINGSEERVKTINVLLDPKNKNGTKHGEFYYFTPSSSKDPDYYALGNMNRAIGYDKLQRDILKEFDDSAQEWKFARRDLERLLEQLSIASYTGKKNAHLFQKNSHGELTDAFLATLPRDEGEKYLGNPSQMKELLDSNEVQGEERLWLEEQLAANWGDLPDDPENPVKVNLDKSPYLLKEGYRTTYLYPKTIQNARKQNQVIDFVEGYIQNTYDIFLQREYEKDIDKQTRASAWQTKKNINKDTRKIMETTTLNKYFQFVEIDNDVDLALFSQFEEEMEWIHDILPKTGEKLPELRLRKLGNHKALGLFVPTKNTIAIDFRDTDDEIGGVGIQSFVHEYGHALDYGIDNGRLLSMRDDFKPIVARYRANLSLNGKGSYVAEKAEYYTAPTEVFARAFELYVSETGLSSIFLKSKETYSTSIEYALFDQKMREKITTFFDSVFPDLKTAVLESSKEQSDLDQETVQERVDKEVDSIKSMKFFHENNELTVGEALESCELSLVGKATAIQMQEETIELYTNAIPQTDTMEQITEIHKNTLDVMKELPEGTLFLFDGSELADYSLDHDEMLSMIGEREVFHGVYGNSLTEMLFPSALISEQSQSKIDVKQIGDERSVSAAEEQLRKWLSLPEEAQNEILIITFRNPVNAKLALMKYGLEDVDSIFSSLNNPLGVEWEHRYKNLTEDIKAFDDNRRKWLNVYGEERAMYIPETLWPIAEKLGMMENYPKLPDKVENSLSVPNKAEATDLNLTSTNSTEAATSEEDLEDNSRLGQARRKLLRLRNEYNEKFDQLFAHQELTNGQPMNDKRNGQSWFNRRDQIENSIRNLSDQIKQQEDRVSKLEEQKENKEMGLNKQGGLIMSVENIPRIQEEIEKSKTGESRFSKDTIRKYTIQLEELIKNKDQSDKAHKNISKHSQALIDSKAITQWTKNPMIYFIKGLNKVALELQEDGDFIPSEKYSAKTTKDQEVIETLLKSKSREEFQIMEVPIVYSNPFYELDKFNQEIVAVNRFWTEVLDKRIPFEIYSKSLNADRSEKTSLALVFSYSSNNREDFQLTEFDQEGQAFTHDVITQEQLEKVLEGDSSNLLRLFPYSNDVAEYTVKFIEDEKTISMSENETHKGKEGEEYSINEGGDHVLELHEIEEIKNVKYIEIGNQIEVLKQESMDHRDKQQWDKVAEIDWALRKLDLQVEVLDENSVEPILKEVAEFEIDIAGLESIEVANDNPEQSTAIKDRILRSKEKIQELVGIQESYSKFYKEKLGIEIGNTSNAFKTQLESALIQIENNQVNESAVSLSESGQSRKVVEEDNPMLNDMPRNDAFIQDINVAFNETKQDVDHFMKQMIHQGVQHVNKSELETILENHLKQVELVIRNSISAVDSMMNPSENQIQSETKTVKRSIGSILGDLKKNIKQYFATKKENTVSKLKSTKEDVRLGFKNSFNRKILAINGLLRQLSNKIEQKFVIEEKQIPSNQVEISNDPDQSSQQPSPKDLSVQQVETKTPGNTVNENIQESAEKPAEVVAPSAEKSQSSLTESLEGKDQSENEIKGESVEVSPAEKEMNNIELQQMKRIEELSDKLGMKANEKEKTSIKELSQAQKAELIRSMEAVVEEKSKSVSTEEAELEVG
ncbi:LPD1 domain-containing protein [Enterococcus sp. CR-Ec1]|uniref:LPD1 domain-containing protein n=1 Tax=Enterococcus sp. CR-Ec1 TaxID=2057791 RepID=UPI0013053D4C|nr:LPD1 domain-containing protein [Enterococcus sp. CR-Ec1]